MSGSAPKTQYYTASTLDGFIASPDHSLDWPRQFGVWLVGGGDLSVNFTTGGCWTSSSSPSLR